MRCTFYEVAGCEYYQLDRWEEHQHMRHPSKSTFPPNPNGVHAESKRHTRRNAAAYTPSRNGIHAESLRPEEVGEVGEVEEVDRAAPASPRHAYAPHVSMTPEEHNALVAKHGADVVALAIELLDAYKLEKGKHYKSDAGALRSWGIQAALERREKGRRSGASPPGAVRFTGRKCEACGELNTHSGSACLTCGEDLPRRGGK